MLFWLTIAVGILVAVFAAVKLGFYQIWAFALNSSLAIFLAIHLQPVILRFFPNAANIPFGNTLLLGVLFAAVYVILYLIVSIFFLGQFVVFMPGIVDTLGAGILGFFNGTLIVSFVVLLLATTPLAQFKIGKTPLFSAESIRSNVKYVTWFCERINNIVGSTDSKITSEDIIEDFFKSTKRKSKSKTTSAVKVEESVESPSENETNETETIEKETEFEGLLK